MIISLVGKVDKRPISYGLLKILGELGTTILVTDNKYYSSASKEGSSYFILGNSEVVISKSEERAFDHSEWDRDEYDYIIYDYDNYAPYDTDLLIPCLTGNERDTERVQELADLFEDNQQCVIRFSKSSSIAIPKKFDIASLFKKDKNQSTSTLQPNMVTSTQDEKEEEEDKRVSIHCSLSSSYFSHAWNVENDLILHPISDSTLASAVCKILEIVTGNPAKEWETRMKRKWVNL